MGDAIAMQRTKTYSVMRFVTALCFHTVLPVTYHHTERLQGEAPFVAVSNHVHALDPAVVAYPFRKEQLFFLAKKELAKTPLVRKFLLVMHCVLVDRHHTDMEAMRTCMKILREKNGLVIFPEGTRHHEGQMEQIESGTGLIVMRSGAPVIPMYIDRPLRLFRRVHVYIGDPIPYDDLRAGGVNSVSCGQFNERLRETFRQLIAEAEKPAS